LVSNWYFRKGEKRITSAIEERRKKKEDGEGVRVGFTGDLSSEKGKKPVDREVEKNQR